MSGRDRTISPFMASLIKGMLVRGDDQSDIAACFLVNGGRISEINTGKRMPDVEAAAPDDLPPPGPYPSPYELHKAGLLVWHTRVALQHTKDKIELALKALDAVELAP